MATKPAKKTQKKPAVPEKKAAAKGATSSKQPAKKAASKPAPTQKPKPEPTQKPKPAPTPKPAAAAKKSVKLNVGDKPKKTAVKVSAATKKPSKSADASKAKAKISAAKVPTRIGNFSSSKKAEKTLDAAKPAPSPFSDSIVVRSDDRPSHHIAFTLADLDAYFKDKQNNVQPRLSKKDFGATPEKKAQPAPEKKKQPKGALKLENKSQGVATLFDILGFNPVETPSPEKAEGKDIPRKWKKYYNMLVELRDRHCAGVQSRSQEVMKRSAKDDAGDLSSYGQHLADAGSGSFERDLAYNMISSQTEILGEIDAAIARIKNGTYGICEVTGKPIPEARLNAIPFARYTLEGQKIHEQQQQRLKSARRESVFDMGLENSSGQGSQEEEDSEPAV